MIIDPATANELISTPSRFKIISPTNKNTIIITTDTIEAFSDSITLYFSLSKMIKGILPITSIIANKIIVDEINSFKSKFISQKFSAQIYSFNLKRKMPQKRGTN